MGKTIDLNADIGECAGGDAELIPLVTSVNIACGAHAGDLNTMEAAVRAAIAAGVAIGAHPGYADREFFGRRELSLSLSEIEKLLSEQIDTLQPIAEQAGGVVSYVKLHGALYHQAGRDRRLADCVVALVQRTAPELAFLGVAGSQLEAAAQKVGARFFAEAFADRAYDEDGGLAARSEPGAVIDEPRAAARQAIQLARQGLVTNLDGKTIPVRNDSLCLHGDTPRAVELARSVRKALVDAGIRLKAFTG